jgi:hypothetical protein
MWPLRTHEPTDVDIRVLNTLKKTRKLWSNDKQFSKIVEKMQKGKNLKTKEFNAVQSYLRETCRHH